MMFVSLSFFILSLTASGRFQQTDHDLASKSCLQTKLSFRHHVTMNISYIRRLQSESDSNK